MKILVAGGAGFLGSNLIGRLLDRDDVMQVTVLDNFQTGRLSNLEPFKWDLRFHFVPGDIVSLQQLDRICNTKWDRIYNLACPASPVHYQAAPIHTMLTCVTGTYNLLRLAQKSGARFLQASTSEVYGDPSVSPQPESYRGSVNCFGPRACYDEGKRAAEALIYDYRNVDVDTRIVRIFNTYGPRMRVDDGRVISNFLTQAIRGEPLTIYGDGSQTRSFCYVSDLIDGLITVMESNYKDPVNLGNPNEFTLNELIDLIKKLFPEITYRLTYKRLPKDDPKQRKPDITVANSLGWKPIVELDRGLRSTFKYFKEELS